jgi:ABC-2 type transport system ATP-binding protein
LAQGTGAEVIASQNLSSWTIYGDGLIELQDKLRSQPGVDQTVIFGDSLHVSGTDGATLERSVQSTVAERGHRAEKIQTGLEDVFIHMMSRSADNFGGPL